MRDGARYSRSMPRTLLALLVPEAEPLVGDLRARMDPSARRGLGAHITLVYPFIDSLSVTPEVLERLRGVTARHGAFSFRLADVGTFPSTVWLGPTPADAIARLVVDLEASFPDRPRAGPVFDGFVPHLSVARNVRRDHDAIVSTCRGRLLASGEVACRAREVHVMERADAGWRVLAAAPLAKA